MGYCSRCVLDGEARNGTLQSTDPDQIHRFPDKGLHTVQETWINGPIIPALYAEPVHAASIF